jgi:hypothetical protein
MFGISAGAAAAIGSIGGAVIGGIASNKAAGKIAGATNKASDIQQGQYEQTRADNEPWRLAGQNALDNLTGILNSGKLSTRFSMADFTNDAGYQFAAKEGQRAIANQANAMGGGGLGAMRRAAQFAEGNANQFYGDAYNRWRQQNQDQWGNTAQLAGFGPPANNALAQAGQQNATAQGNLLTGNAGMQAGLGLNMGNVYSNALNQGMAAWNRGQTPSSNPLPVSSYNPYDLSMGQYIGP